LTRACCPGTQLGAKEGALGQSVYKRLEAALIAFATLSALLQARNSSEGCMAAW